MTSRTLLGLVILFVVTAFAGIIRYTPRRESKLSEKLIILFVALLLTGQAVVALFTGRANWGRPSSRVYTLAGDPVDFWTIVIFFGGIGTVVILALLKSRKR